VKQVGTERIILGTPPFSSPDPATEKGRMVPINHGGPSVMASDGSAQTPEEAKASQYDDMTVQELAEETSKREIDMSGRGTGKDGALKKSDYIDALQGDDDSEGGDADNDGDEE
jgi:hypothetical protein